MPPLEPLTVALPLAIAILVIGWRPWKRGVAPRAGPIASALAIGGGWLGSWLSAFGAPGMPPRDSRERLFYALALATMLAPLDASRLRRWAALAWIALAAAFAWLVIPPLARGQGWEGARLYLVLAAVVAWLLFARAATGGLLALLPRGPLIGGALCITWLATGISQALGGSIGLATGFSCAAVAACCVALLARVRREWETLSASASTIAMVNAGGLLLALLIVPGFPWPSAALLAAAPFTAALPLGDATRDRGWITRLLPVLACAALAAWLVWSATTTESG